MLEYVVSIKHFNDKAFLRCNFVGCSPTKLIIKYRSKASPVNAKMQDLIELILDIYYFHNAR